MPERQKIRVAATMHDQAHKPEGYEAAPRPSDPLYAYTKYGTKLVEAVAIVGAFALVDDGVKNGRHVYHMPSRCRVPAIAPGQRDSRLIDGSRSHRTLRDAREFMNEVAAADILPDDRPASHADIRNLRAWLETREVRP